MSLAWRLALRDLRGGFGGLRLLAICLFLGVAAIAGIGSLSSAILAELSVEGRTILGGDIRVSLSQRQAQPNELEAMARLGRISQGVRMRAMASRADATRSVLIELKSVDDAYPLYGALTVAPGAIARRPAAGVALIAPEIAERLNIHVGDPLRIGDATVNVGGIIASEPDHVGEGFALGPTALIDGATLDRTGLIQPGSLYSARYCIALPPGRDAGLLAKKLSNAHTDWRVQDSRDGAPSLRRSISRIGQFLTLVSLAALVVAGIGVGNGVGTYLEGKRPAIATLKTLGATSGLIFRVYLIEVGMATVLAIAVALAAGVFLPALIATIAGDALPVPPRLGLYPMPLLLAAVYGLLIALSFVLRPLARARAIGAATLFRGATDRRGRASAVVTIAAGAALLLAAAIAIANANEPIFAAGFLGSAAVLLLLLGALGLGLRKLAAALPRPRRPLLRLVLTNLHAPGAQTDRLVVALGLGLSLFATLAVIQTSLSGALRHSVPDRAPSFFVLDVPATDVDRFRALVKQAAPDSTLVTVPSLRGPVVAIKGQRVAAMQTIPKGAWMLHGDRSLTFANALPAGNRLTAGRWWPANYTGPPLVSMDADAGEALGLKVGDAITVSALGVEVPAHIASFRKIDWESLGFNFVLIFSPHTFDGAPFNYMAALAVPPARENAVMRAMAQAFPSSSLIRVKDLIATVGGLLGQLATAVAAASTVAIAAGIAVLIGALAATRRARTYNAVLLKLLGATRGQVMLVQALEIGLLALVVGVIALGMGAVAGDYVVTQLFDLPFAPDWSVVVATLLGGMALILSIGLIVTLPALSARPARALREL